jgi:pimeloyl-ACP methyl ester carboxylesterase
MTMNEIVNVEGIGNVDVSFTERGEGRPMLVLHGGAGTASVLAWAELVGRSRPARVITPSHPGFDGTARPEALCRVVDIARVYAALLDRLGLHGVTVVGNSIGGWIAAELAILAPNRIRNLVLVNAGGIDVPEHPMLDVFSMTPAELSQKSFHNPDRFRIDPSQLPPAQRERMAANRATLKLYLGAGTDASLGARLAASNMPRTLVVWGESDRVVPPEYGRAYAAAIRGAEFRLLSGAGHMPQLETPELLADTIWPFVVDPAAL